MYGYISIDFSIKYAFQKDKELHPWGKKVSEQCLNKQVGSS